MKTREELKKRLDVLREMQLIGGWCTETEHRLDAAMRTLEWALEYDVGGVS